MAYSVVKKVKDNYRGFWKNYRWFLVIFVAALLCDGISTVHFMVKHGPDGEMHFGVRLLSRILGPVAGPLLSVFVKAAAGFAVALYLRRFAPYIFVTVSIISFWAAWYNIWGFKIYTANIFYWFPW